MSEGTQALLQVTGVTKRFARRRPWRDVLRRPFAEEWVDALHDVSIDVREGEFFGLLGANGAGKTTLMKVIATLMLPDSGRVLVDGRDAERDASGVRDLVALSLATERGLYWRLTGRENLALFAELFMLPRTEVKDRVDEALDAVGLASSGTADRMVSEYSSGMTQRLLIARALMTRPRVLLLDEPTRSLDPVSAREFRAFLREELSRRGCAVLLATHNADEAFGLCDRVCVMAHGRVLATGAASDLAHSVVGRRHQLVTTEPGHPAFAELIRSGDLLDASPDEQVESPGPWRRLRLTIPGGDAEAARLLATLHLRGVPVASFSPQATTLADLIEGVVGSRSGGGPR